MDSSLPRAILFDLDDTIIDDSSSVEPSWLAAIEAEAAVLSGCVPREVVAAVHEVRTWYWANPERHRTGRADLRSTSAGILNEALARFGMDDPDLARRIADRYRDLRSESIALFPNSIETLEHLRSLGVRTALLTNGDSAGQRAKLTRFDLARHFDYICIEGEYGCGKPDERVYVGALESLGCPADDAWMIGDNLEWDVAAPMRLGIRGIWHDRFKAGLPEDGSVKPDRIVYGIGELLTS